MKNKPIYPIVLAILDGWGQSQEKIGNAIQLANTPTMDTLQQTYPTTLLDASGLDVGLPQLQVGNSEVGHTTIGGGRIIPQDLVRISSSIKDNSFENNRVLKNLCKTIYSNKSKIHLIGLCSNGGVHSHIDHLLALLNMLKKEDIQSVCIHFITDGRDTSAKSAATFINKLITHIEHLKLGKICTISGRYYAMDRDCRWDRIETFYNVLIDDSHYEHTSPLSLIHKFYDQDISDEFIIPTRINKGAVEDNDGIIFFNFRPDRMRQLVQAFKKENFKGFHIQPIQNLELVTFTQYDSTLNIPIAFKPLEKINFLGEIISQCNLKQLRIAETEKYAHVTYFFNGGLEEPFPGEDRELIASPKVQTYDEVPEMSANQVTQSVISAINKNIYSIIIVNYANPDMIGHTGNLSQTIKAIESVDTCLIHILDAVSHANGTLIITADHGNAECMIDKNQQPCKSHTTNLVPFILIEGEGNKIIGHGGEVMLKEKGSLADIAPTIIDILNLEQPKEMTGTTLIKKNKYEIRNKAHI